MVVKQIEGKKKKKERQREIAELQEMFTNQFKRKSRNHQSLLLLSTLLVSFLCV